VADEWYTPYTLTKKQGKKKKLKGTVISEGRIGTNLGSVPVGIIVDKVEMGQILPPVL
jgi:hypothetical protein